MFYFFEKTLSQKWIPRESKVFFLPSNLLFLHGQGNLGPKQVSLERGFYFTYN